jgi:hypothetical protein
MDVYVRVLINNGSQNLSKFPGADSLGVYNDISGRDGAGHGPGVCAVVGAGLMRWRTSRTAKEDRDRSVRFCCANMNVGLNDRG